MKTLTLLAGGYDHPDLEEQMRIERAGRAPRQSLYGITLNSTLMNGRYMVTRVPPFRRWAYRLLPLWASQVLEAYIIRNRFDAIICWDARLGLMFALLQKLTFVRVPTMVMFSWISPPKKARVLKFVHTHIDRMFTWSSVQRDFLLHSMKIPGHKVVFCTGRVDQTFYTPVFTRGDMIVSVGREMRDYVTLIRAIRDLPVPCHIAVTVIPGIKDAWITELEKEGSLPDHVSLGTKNFVELRELYARAKFVVVPLIPTDTDNGITTLLEAMASGKAVICTRTEGQKDIVQDGVNGVLVPPFDPKAMRAAIDHLLAHPEEADRMGRAGRAWVEQKHNLDNFVSAIRKGVEDGLEEFRRNHRAPHRHMEAA
jgi:glycosyltransferase involved in cell wall biosynthesis